MPNIIFVSLDLNRYIEDDEKYFTAYGKYLNLTIAEKVAYIIKRIEEVYKALNQQYPNYYIMIVLREAAIGAKTNDVIVAASIVTEAEKDEAINRLKAVTNGKKLIIIPGSIAYSVKAPNNTTLVYNRAYFLMGGEIVGYQDKVKFSPTDLKDCKLENPQAAHDEKNQLKEFSIDKQRFTIRISICLDHDNDDDKPPVDFYLLISNSTYLMPEKAKGKMIIHCDGNRPTAFISKLANHNYLAYVSPLILSFSLYKYEIKLLDAVIAEYEQRVKVVNTNFTSPEKFQIMLSQANAPIHYPFEEIYKPTDVWKDQQEDQRRKDEKGSVALAAEFKSPVQQSSAKAPAPTSTDRTPLLEDKNADCCNRCNVM